MWSNACRGILNLLLDELEAAGSLAAWEKILAARSFGTDTIQWLEAFYAKAAQYLRVPDLFYRSILPNQYGRFCAPANLKTDEIRDEELKAVSVSFRGERAECDLPERLLDRRLQLPGWNLPSLGLETASSGVNAALQQFLAQTSLPEAPLELQEACTRLLGWIQEHPAQAGRCFPAFCREEDQMKLLTPKAAVNLRKKADRLGELLALAGTEDPEMLAGLIRNGLRENASRLPEDLPDFDPESGIFFGEDWSDTQGEARRERLRRIGEAGERCAFQALADHFANRGFAMELEDGGLAQFSGEDTRVTIRRADTEEYRQPGWDIEVKIQREQEECYYLEIKTHTPRSRARALLPLSDTQMRLAAGLGENYVLLLVIYDEALDQAVEMYPFRNVVGHLADGTLRGAEGRFVLRWQEA